MGFSVIPEPVVSGLTGPQGPAGTIPSDPVFAGSAGINDTTGDPNLDIKKNGSLRWKVRSAGTESGSNVGSDLWIEAFADDGTTKTQTPIWISRTMGQVTIGAPDDTQTGVRLSVADGIGLRNRTDDPGTSTLGPQLYAKAGKLWVQTVSGAERFQVAPAPVTSVNGKTGAASLNAADVGALPTTGGTLGGELNVDGAAGTYREFSFKTGGVKRWSIQAENSSEAAGDGTGSDFRIFSRNNDGTFNLAGLSITRKWAQTSFGDGGPLGDAKATTGGAHGLRNMTWEPALPNAGALLYARNGVPYAKQGDGAVYSLTPPSSFTPESLGVLAWAGDPGTVASGSDYSGVGQGRMTAVYVSRSMSISKIVWHMQGYAGGLLAGSWAAVYDTAGTLKGATGDMSTAAYEPAAQSAAGGGWSSAPLTAPVTLAPGIYYVCWRFNYTASPVDGPALTRWDSVDTTNGLMGLGTAVWRFAKFTSSATSAPSSITPSTLFSANGIQFWVALA
ncbi:hypothetical protein [Streptomyces pseudovenezuelae]|uniref:hypothetical protein n=1 Tax=Streptomyces pseudovenezuelae TaxID=67350 RepID=UPI002E30E2F2|nr:hypothetical protein [Streptomyces pseudovenezuelae]